MALHIMDRDGKEQFELRYGKPATDAHVKDVTYNARYTVADGVELDQCNRILGRPPSKGEHRFTQLDTQEIVLNWR
jgi:hypothetical protein